MPFATRTRIEDANMSDRTECSSAARAVDDIRVCDILANGVERECHSISLAKPWPAARQNGMAMGRAVFVFGSASALTIPYRSGWSGTNKRHKSPLTSVRSMSINALLLIRNITVHSDDVKRTTDPACHESTRGGYSTPWHSGNCHQSPGVHSAFDFRGMRSNDQLPGWIRSQPGGGWCRRKWILRRRRTRRGTNHPDARRSPGTHRVCESQYGRC
jgi:hypothetical protein